MEFDLLAKSYSKLIYSVIYSLGIDHNIDEYYQVGLIGLWEGSERFNKEKGSFPPFIRTYIRWKLINALKLENSRQIKSISIEDWLHTNPIYTDRPLEKELLLSHFSHLTDLQRRWVILHFYYGLTQEDIADMEQIPSRRVRSWGDLALKKCLLRETNL
ncbi:sigma-70 family RNA polymerase sigma factor [Niallia sp. Krafla_26]|uniref:sigma-70 family RNA polymerase sigma factor n=1 Tax=Niallia sp. Krafla_26 TaxID=3064703 RepID=UPI003D1718A8